MLLRHAKSAWPGDGEPGVPDHGRPLAGRGRRTADAVGSVFAGQGLRRPRIVSSDARRARETAERLADRLGAEVELEPRLYLGGPREVRAVLESHRDPERDLVLVGHNPGFEEAASALTGRPEALKTGDSIWLGSGPGGELTVEDRLRGRACLTRVERWRKSAARKKPAGANDGAAPKKHGGRKRAAAEPSGEPRPAPPTSP